MRTLIRKGLVVTGDGSRPSLADILIEDSLIARVGKDISCEADDVVDAQGLVVMHTGIWTTRSPAIPDSGA